jgi:hypothetical protein
VIQRAVVRNGLYPIPTPSSRVRVSLLHKLCPRADVLRFMHNVAEADNVEADLGVTFAIGTALHYAMQNLMLSKTSVLEGMWRCEKCGHLYGDMPYKDHLKPAQIASRISCPAKCDKCKHDTFKFEEYFFVDEELGLQGHCDGLLNMPALSDEPVLFELKSIAQSQTWKIRDTPIIDHVIQVHGYMMLSGLSKAIVLYWVKGVHGMPALKEFVVERDDDLVATLTEALRQRKEGLEKGIVPEDRVCATADCARASGCPVRQTCFSNYVPEPDSAAGQF